MKEINKKKFMEKLMTKQFVFWITLKGVNEFCIPEEGMQYGKKGSHFYEKEVDPCDRNTWIHNEFQK